MIVLNSKAQLTVDVIAKVAEHKITIANATKLLNKSRRTVERYLQVTEAKGYSLSFTETQAASQLIKRLIALSSKFCR
ncbi:hypothetical protein D210916BOD24_17530 [Alteromonas sp. D210916BOD_24]